MKKTVLFTFVLLIFQCCNNNSNLISQSIIYPNFDLKGEVFMIHEVQKSVTERVDFWKFKREKLVSGKIYDFRGKDNKYTVTTYISSHQPLYKTQYEIDKNGEIIEGQTLMDNKIRSRHIIKKNARQQVETLSVVNEDTQSLFSQTDYFYKGNALTQYIISNKSQERVEQIFYLDEGKIIKNIARLPSGKLKYISNYVYNNNGVVSKIEFLDSLGQIINLKTYDYEYDEQENWTKRLMTDTQKDIRVLTYRTISYEKQSQPLTTQELEGYWINWTDNTVFGFRNGRIYLKEQKTEFGKKRSKRLAGKFYFNTSTNILSAELGRMKSKRQFHISYDGAILTLKEAQKTYFLRKITLAEILNEEKMRFTNNLNIKPIVESFKEGKNYGLKDENGKIIIPAQYENLSALTQKGIKVKKDGKWGLINYKGEQLTDFKYEKIIARNFGYFRYGDNYKYGLLSPEGEEVTPPIYSKLNIMENGLVLVEKDQSKEGVIDLKGNEVLPMIYNDFRKIIFNRAFAYTGRFNNNWINSKYEIVKELNGYGQVYPLDINCFKMQQNGGWGLMDSIGNEIIPPQFSEIFRGNATLATAQKDNKYGLINVEGKQLTPMKYDFIRTSFYDRYVVNIQNDLSNHNAVAIFFMDGEFGYLDGYGKEIKPAVSEVFLPEMLKTYDLFEQVKVTYPSFWRQMNNGLVNGDRDANPIISFSIANNIIDLQDLINEKNIQNLQVKTTNIDDRMAYYFVTLPSNEYRSVWEKVVFLPLNDQQVFIAKFSCKGSRYAEYAQDFYDILYRLKLL